MKNRGLGMVEIILILTVLIVLVLVFRPALVQFILDVIRCAKGGMI